MIDFKDVAISFIFFFSLFNWMISCGINHKVNEINEVCVKKKVDCSNSFWMDDTIRKYGDDSDWRYGTDHPTVPPEFKHNKNENNQWMNLLDTHSHKGE